MLDWADPDPDTPVLAPNQLQCDEDEQCRIVGHCLNLVARSALERTKEFEIGHVVDDVPDAIDVPSTTSLIHCQYEHLSMLCS
ncbi:hypothetical protein GCM10020255_081190 [Rhodococcus baikonurensis]